MKQTAVDYLFEKLWGIHKDKFTWQMILKEAKQKEKRQIKEAYNTGVWDVGCRNSDSEQYYNENFNIK
jgi:N12 class adenine-specific DNA methylase